MPGRGDFTDSVSPAGVDFPYLLFADQMGELVEDCRAKAGVGWLRLLTDIPTGAGRFATRSSALEIVRVIGQKNEGRVGVL